MRDKAQKRHNTEGGDTIADYIRADTTLPAYLPYPRFLLKMEISQTAKLLYALLLDRSTLSQKNGWQDGEGRIFSALYVSEDNVTSCAMQAFIAGYCEISLIKSVSERRNYFEPGTDEYYNRKANTSSANTIGNDTGRTSRGIECYPAGTIELGERC